MGGRVLFSDHLGKFIDEESVSCRAGPIAYLSSPSLLNLQLQDVTFRRHHLVQIAMLLHYAVISNESKALQVCSSVCLATNAMFGCCGSCLSLVIFILVFMIPMKRCQSAGHTQFIRFVP